MAAQPILSAVVIGGEGFLGHNLVQTLKTRFPKAAVASFDVTQRFTPSGYTFESVDLNNKDTMLAALKRAGADTVFHTASPWVGASKEISEKVNVQGTKTVIAACQEASVKKLVYTSSGSVCFDETPLINIDERLTMPEHYTDDYMKTKAQADLLVLEANDPQGLLTCSIRPSGIFGPGDRQAVPGFLQVLKDGKAKYQMGNNENMFDWTYVDNVVHAHILAAERLHKVVPWESFIEPLSPLSTAPHRRPLPTSLYRPTNKWLPGEERKLVTSAAAALEDYDSPLAARRNRFDQFVYMGDQQQETTNQLQGSPEGVAVAGQAFYVTNGEPMPFWDFAKALYYEYNGFAPDKYTVVPPALGLWMAGWAETFNWILRRPPPNMSLAKINNTITSRYFNIEKARRLLDYEPLVGLEEAVKRSVAWYKDAEVNHPELIKPKA